MTVLLYLFDYKWGNKVKNIRNIKQSIRPLEKTKESYFSKKISTKMGVLLLGLPLIVSACGGGATTTATPKKTIYFIFTGYTPPYFAPMANGIKAAVKHYPNLSMRIIDAQGSASTEITDINEAVAAGAKGIILNPVNGSVTAAASNAMSKGVPVITIDRDVSSPSARIAFIGDQDKVLGHKQTAYGLKWLSSHNIAKPWHVAILQGTLGSSTAIDRLAGAMSALKPYLANGSAKIVLNQSANFDTATAATLMNEFLAKTTNVQLVVAGNDAMALGALNAFQSHGITPGKSVVVTGADAQPESLAAIKQGTQLDTVTHSPFVEAFWATEAMNNYLSSKTKPPVSQFPNGNITIPMTVVTKSNVSNISGWGTPSVVPPLPYGKSKSYPSK